MPAFAQRLLPLLCHGSRDVISSSAGCASCTNRRWHPALNQRQRYGLAVQDGPRVE